MNLARSLCTQPQRHPEREAVVDGRVRLTLRRAARARPRASPAGSQRSAQLAGTASRRVLENRHETGLSTGPPVARRDVRPALVARLRRDLDYCIDDSGAGVVATEADGDVHVGETPFPHCSRR